MKETEGGKEKQDKLMCTTKNYRCDTTKIPKDFIEFISYRHIAGTCLYATTQSFLIAYIA